MQDVVSQARDAKQAWKVLRLASGESKNIFLRELAELLLARIPEILEANSLDIRENPDLSEAMRKRLELSEANIRTLADSLYSVERLPDPVGAIVYSKLRKDGLKIKRVRSPIGVIVFIFESRPNVIIDAAALCVKSGNALIVRGGKEALHSNTTLLSFIQQALLRASLPVNAVQQLCDRRHEAIKELVALEAYVDLVIPRGKEALIRTVSEHARVPVMKHTRGLCHAYIDATADTEKAIALTVNGKTSNPATCNSIETILVHGDCADRIMPGLLKRMHEDGVEIRGCERTCSYFDACLPAIEDDWSVEYLDRIVAIRVVDSFEEALEHISRYSSGLTDSIITEDTGRAEAFMKMVDSAVVLVNASNRLADGGQLGLGTEIGISTSRIHMRGPMGLEDLTVTSYRVIGDGHLR